MIKELEYILDFIGKNCGYKSEAYIELEKAIQILEIKEK